MTAILSAPTPELDLKPWLLTLPQVTNVVGNRIYWSFPDTLPAYPALRIQGAGGGKTNPASDLPLYSMNVVMLVAGGKPADYSAVVSAAGILAGIVDTIEEFTFGSTIFTGGSARNVLPSADPLTNNPRYIIDCLISCMRVPGS